MLSNTPTSERIHIAIFGKINAGKSSVFNAITNQNISIVSDISGTTTDPVKKTMEILPLGPVIIYDTAGIDDNSNLGEERYKKTLEVLNKTDIALFVTDINKPLEKSETEFIEKIKSKNIPYLIIYNKSDNNKSEKTGNEIEISTYTGKNITLLKDKISKLKVQNQKFIISDRLNEFDTVLLVIPIDESAPKGRLILPQQLVLRELLDKKCTVICIQPENLKETLNNLKNPPKLIITDSQAFGTIKDIVPAEIMLTSFSILFANYKGDLKTLINGAKQILNLKNNDTVLISEGCTHHRQCNDIGTVKIPNLVKKFTGKDINFEFTQGGEFPENIEKYSLVIHCGACMLNEQEMKSRLEKITSKNISVVNYGILISFINGILSRAVEIFPEITID